MTQTKDKPLKATHTGVIRIGDVELPCFVLEDGRRILSTKGMVGNLGMRWKGGATMAKFASRKRLSPYIPSVLMKGLQSPIPFKNPKGGVVGSGFEATALTDLCQAVLAARRDGALHPQQAHIAVQCEILVAAMANVGIAALVDEATGYQDARPPDALQGVLNAFLAKFKARWEKRFPDEFYRQLCRLLRVPYEGPGAQMPQCVGKCTNDIVYSRLAPGLLKQLEEVNPLNKNGNRSSRHHQWLTENQGTRALDSHISVCIALMSNSPTYEVFKAQLDAWAQRYGATYTLPGTAA